MCGGIREMQGRLPPRLHEEMKLHMPHAPPDMMTLASCRHQPAPAGLAIVAALVQSGGTTSPNKAADSAPSSSSSSSSPALPIPISSSSSSAYEKIHNNRKDNFPACKHSKNHSRHAPTSIFSTSFSPPGCNSNSIMSSNLYRDLYDDFLGVCLSCKRPLAPGKDIYMYRGDQAFCSTECRHKHIVADESLLCNIQINQPCVQASSPTNQPKFTPPVAIAVLV